MAKESMFNDGYFLKDVSDGRTDNLADFSLHSALLNYVKTAVDLDYLYKNRESATVQFQADLDKLYGAQYAMNASNAIVQFQHFLELFFKDVLLGISPLMVYDAAKKPILLYKMAKGEKIKDSEFEGLRFIEFSEAMNRVKELQKNKKLDAKYDFLQGYFNAFEDINRLRNRIAHRGAFIVRHSALDAIFGKHIFPFIQDLSKNVSGYGDALSRWLNIKDGAITPFEFIINEYKKVNPNEFAVYIYKMMAYAGYNNKLNYGLAQYFKSHLDRQIMEAESVADTVAFNAMANVLDCPICGCRTLVEFTDTDSYEDNNDGIIDVWTSVYKIECYQCGFHLNDWLKDRMKGLAVNLPEYFWVRSH